MYIICRETCQSPFSFSRTWHLQRAIHTYDNGGYRSVAHQAMTPRESSRNELSMEAHTTQGIKAQKRNKAHDIGVQSPIDMGVQPQPMEWEHSLNMGTQLKHWSTAQTWQHKPSTEYFPNVTKAWLAPYGNCSIASFASTTTPPTVLWSILGHPPTGVARSMPSTLQGSIHANDTLRRRLRQSKVCV